MENRKKFISNIISVVAIDLIIAAVAIIGYISNHDSKIIVVGIILIFFGDIIAILNGYTNRKEYERVARMVKNALSENDFVEVALSEENEEVYLFDFLEELCTLYATLLSENKIQIIAEITVNDQSVRKEYKVVSFEDFVTKYILLG